jgi:hypothetical protein
MNDYDFRHHPDGIIYIGEDFSCTIDEWLQMEPGYTLPEFFIGREYSTTRYIQRLFTSANEIFIREAWTQGDTYVSNLSSYESQLASIRPKETDELLSA